MAVASKHIPAPNLHPVRRALLSVSDKTGIVEFASELYQQGIELLSTGGTSAVLSAAGLPVRDVSEITNFPEIMDGRVKTLHPSVHGGLLAIRDDQQHMNSMREHGIPEIDMLVSNLYPFEDVRASGSDAETIIENIDIGGPAMIRASAKNHAYVAIVTDAEDYQEILAELKVHGGKLTLATRRTLAARAFARTAAYDSAISGWFAEHLEISSPRHLTVGGQLRDVMRYGENPHQSAGFYVTGEDRNGVATAELVQGKALSYNNINDTDAAFELVSEFSETNGPACAIIKHANPCGVAVSDTLLSAYQKALACDPVSAFGGIVALNSRLDASAAAEIIKVFTEVIIAPSASPEAREIIASKKNLRLLLTGGLSDPGANGLTVKSVAGGFLAQSRDNRVIDQLELQTVTARTPTDRELADLKFAFQIAKHVKSNAIVYARDLAAVGIGAGQMSRIDSSRIAARKAEDAAQAGGFDEPFTRGSVVASDAFFPFADGLLAAVDAGATAVIQPGGSMRDDDVIRAADDAGIAMVFTGTRHFRH